MGESIGIEKISAKTGPSLFAELTEMNGEQKTISGLLRGRYERFGVKDSLSSPLESPV